MILPWLIPQVDTHNALDPGSDTKQVGDDTPLSNNPSQREERNDDANDDDDEEDEDEDEENTDLQLESALYTLLKENQILKHRLRHSKPIS